MTFTMERKSAIFSRTRGRCHLCGRSHSLCSHGRTWHIDHSRSRWDRGTNHLNNLYVACIGCNLSKGTMGAREYRQLTGLTRIPLSQNHIDARNERNAAIGAVAGLIAGRIMGNSWKTGFVVAGVGAVIGYEIQNED